MKNMNSLEISSIPHTWFIDLDGTILIHNGYKMKFGDQIIQESLYFLNSIPSDDTIIITTSRKKMYKNKTIRFLKKNNIRYNQIIFNLPFGERILINDRKDSGMITSISINLDRNIGINYKIVINDTI